MSYMSDRCLFGQHLGLLNPIQTLSCLECDRLALQGLIDAPRVKAAIQGRMSYTENKIMPSGMTLLRMLCL